MTDPRKHDTRRRLRTAAVTLGTATAAAVVIAGPSVAVIGRISVNHNEAAAADVR